MKCVRLGPTMMGLLLSVGALTTAGVALAGPVFNDIARNDGAGISYRRGASSIMAQLDSVKLLPFMSLKELNDTPQKPHGAPGVAIFDYDRDGDLDLYVPNGPGRGNSLYQNRFAQTGTVTFIDVGAVAGVAAADQDSTGVCYGDIDNDGDADLMVNGRMEASRLFRNNGNGSFSDITATSNVGGGARAHTACTMGDVKGDGLLDIYVSNTFDWLRNDAIFTDSFAFNQENELYLNAGGNTFTDGFEAAGLSVLEGVPPGDATISWTSTFVDYDQDGDLDLFQADDQGAMAPSFFAGVNRGYMQLFENDGLGNFVNMTGPAGLTVPSSWMGFSFGDINCDDQMDFFSPSVGDYLIQQFGIPTPPGYSTSKWFLGGGTGSFTGPGVGALGVTPFGWGNGMADVDNDGDTDIVFYGGLDVGPFLMLDNPGVVLLNDSCSGNFSWDQAATAPSADLVSRQVTQGVALGDLNQDGFVDIVHVSSDFVPPSLPIVSSTWKWGSVFDATANVAPTFLPVGPLEWEWAGQNTQDGRLGVEINGGGNGNRWVRIRTRGSVGLTPGAKSNRDGVGAILKFKPKNGKTSMAPVLAGSSYASQHAPETIFGLGTKSKGTLDVMWPGGTHNRLYNVDKFETVTMPEIPCDFAATWPNRNAYRTCVNTALDNLRTANVITNSERTRFRDSAMKAYDDEN